MSNPRRPECPGCAAIYDAQQLFPIVEQFAQKRRIDPDAMQAALTELLALWVAVNTSALIGEGEIQAPVDGVLIATINEYGAAIRARASSLPVSAEFKQASAEQSRHRH